MPERHYERCKTCGEFGWTDTHHCPPTWEARVKDNGDDWDEVHAYDADGAAAKFAEHYDCNGGEYQIVSSGSAQVEVRKCGEDEVLLFDISAETVPQYSAWKADT